MKRQVAWVPEPLLPYWSARQVLGVKVYEDQVPDVPLPVWLGQWENKVLNLLKKEQDPRPLLEDQLQDPGFASVANDPEAVYDQMCAYQESWRVKAGLLHLYLRGELNLKDLLDQLYLKEEDKYPVSPEEFLKELDELDLALFLELVL